MKKGLLLLMAGVMALGVAAQSFAGARLGAMSADVRQVEDYDLIWIYANKIVDYKGTADFRFNDSFNEVNDTLGDEWGGVLVAEEGLGVIGAYINRPNRSYSTNHGLIDGLSGSPISRRTWNRTGNVPWYYDLHDTYFRALDLFWGDDIQDMTLGVQVTYADGFTDGNDSLELGLAVGLGFKDVGPFKELNIHAGYQMEQISYGAGVTDNGISTIKIGGLGVAELSADNDLRVFADAEINNYDITDHAGEKYSDLATLIGVSCAHKVNGGKGLLSTGLLVDYISSNEYDSFVAGPEDDLYIQWNVLWSASLEVQATNWLALRTGISKAIFSRAYENGAGNGGSWYSNNDDDVNMNAGFGIKWQNFELNGLMNLDTLEELIAGPNAGAGIFYPGNQNQGIVEVVSADLKYKF